MDMIRSARRTFLSSRIMGLAAAAAILTPALAVAGRKTSDSPERLETGKQGETLEGEAGAIFAVPYSKGVNIVGHDRIGGRTGNLIMTWSDSCAYVAEGMTIKADGQLEMLPVSATSGVAVIDASNPAAPKTVRYLRDKGSLHAEETLSASTTSKRAVLAASTYGGVAGINGPKEGWLSIYDVKACNAPVLKAEVKWPEPAHTIRVSPDGRYVYGTMLNPFTGVGGVEIMDISDMSNPRFVGKFAATRADGSSFQFGAHELTFSADASRVYVGVTTTQGADAEHEFRNPKPGVPMPADVGQDAGGIFIFDNSDFVANKASPKLRLIGSAPRAGWHSPALARIGGRSYIVNAGEMGACPGAWPRITSIADERAPKVVGEFKLAMNRTENCPAPTPMEKATGGMVGRAGVASTHFQDVDDAANTRLGLFSFMFAGLRIVDLRKVEAPTEVAYFKPGDPCMSHVRYMPKTGQIWFACNASGFYVITLKPELRKKLRLPRVAA